MLSKRSSKICGVITTPVEINAIPMGRFTSCIIFTIAVGPILAAQEQKTGQTDMQDSIHMEAEIHPIVVFAPVRNLPYTVSGIDRNAIARLSEPIIEPLLNATPGLWMQSGTLNTNRISIRGVGYREPFATTGIKVYLDEIPLTNGTGEASIEDIHPMMLSGIEVIRGPASALWGAGLGGMIMLNAALPQRNVLSGRWQAGSFGRIQADQHLTIRYGAHDQWGTTLHYQYLGDNGYRENNTYRRHSLTWMQQWQGDRGWSVRTFLHGIALKAFIPSSITQDDYTMRPHIAAPTWADVMGNEDYTKWIAGAMFGYTSPGRWVYRGAVFGNGFDSDEVRPFNVLAEGSLAYGTRHRVAWRVRSNAHVTTGFEYFRERYDASTFETLAGGVAGQQLSDLAEYNSYVHAFAQSDWQPLRRLLVFTGISYALNRLRDDMLQTQVPASIYPTLGARFHLTGALSVSASLSRGYTAMSLGTLLNADGSIPEGIRPEQGWSREAGVAFETKTVRIRLTIYNMGIRNTIITRRIMDDLFEKYNGGHTRHRGVEMEYRLSGNRERWTWSGAYTHNAHRFVTFNDGGTDFGGNALPGIPAHRFFHEVNVMPIARWRVSLQHHWLSSLYLNDGNALHADGYHLINSTMDYRFKTGDKLEWTCTVHMHNVFDTRYAPMFQINAPGAAPRHYYPGKPRAVYGSVAVHYLLN